MAGALALATAVSPVMAKTVQNEDGTTTTALDKFRVEKVFQYPEGVNQPEVTFDFNATSTTQDAATMTINSISIDNSDDVTTKDGISTVKDYGNINFGNWKHAGVYEYTVTEKSAKTDATDTFVAADGVVYDQSSYTVRVYVENTENGDLKVTNITAIKGTDAEKVSELSFTNTYNDTTKQRLTITKNTVGKQADLTKSFSFTITLKKPAVNANDATSVTGKISNKKTPALTKDVEVTYGTPTTFTLANGETLVFADLQAGTTYSITENGVKDGYTPSLVLGDTSATVEYKEGNAVLSKTKDEASATGTGIIKQVSGQYGNTATFTNTYQDSPLTGVIVNNMPYIALLGASGAGLVVLAASKKRSKK